MAERSDWLDELVEEAGALFEEQGFEGTTVNQILRAIELSKGGLYHRIESKAELLYLAARHACDLLRERVIEPVRSIEDPSQRLRSLTRRHLELILNARGMLSVPSAEAGVLEPKQRAAIVASERRYVAFVRDIFAELCAAGRVRDVDATVAAFNHVAMILHVPRWYRPDGRLDPDEIADRITATSLATVAPSH